MQMLAVNGDCRGGKAMSNLLATDGIESLVEGLLSIPEREAGRVDADEQQFGRTAQRGIIADVEDADNGSVAVQTGEDNEIPARIIGYRYPIPRVGDEVLVIFTTEGAGIAIPTAPELPNAFLGEVRSGDTAGAAVIHHFNVSPRIVPVVPANTGITMNIGDSVICVIDYQALVADSAYVNHTIYAVANVGG